MTQAAGTPAAKARASIWWANCGLVAKRRSSRNAGLPAALTIVRPFLGQIEFPIEQRMAQRAGIAQKHADLAVVHFPDRALYCRATPDRVAAFFGEPSFVEDQHAVGIAEMLPDISVQLVSDASVSHWAPAQQALEAVGSQLSADFRDLPAVLALGLTEQAAQIGQDPVAGLRAGEIGRQPPARSAM